MNTAVGIFLLIYGAVILFYLAIAWYNSLGYESIGSAVTDKDTGARVTVIIPARNEINNIKSCLCSLVKQKYNNYSILVVDGDSTDGTRDFLEAFSTNNKQVSWVAEEPLPDGWVGKSFACWQGAQQADGEWLYFVDADTEHAPTMISATQQYIRHHNLDFLSLMTGQKMSGFWENVILPNVFLWFGTRFPIRKVNDPQSSEARATGQFIAIRKDVYNATSGHHAIRDKVVEDFAFAGLVKDAGYKIRVAGGNQLVTTRMYRTFAQIWEGFSKNIFFAGGQSLFGTVQACLYIFLTQIFPFVVPLYLVWNRQAGLALTILALFPAVLAIIVRVQLNILLKLRHIYIITIPLGGIITCGIHLNSARMYFSGKGMKWKGRIYAKH
ncbi:MAG: glycosyltransferase [Candidatus Auribacter fodinae]|jgi:chlorobactene glucosyltransferase|uniref:Glycosyltransferase n=1 Tax=Candidatus Auribacter fodinae TaxID=2093366 RepID=A0A3A4RH01_9BACT|nr:MAG: glycosyltransferase [Candidatus Auribacter fodinae]